jgi:hypothetical protein
MTNEQFDVLKEEFISNIKSYVTECGGIFPHISVFADIKNPKEGEDKPALIHIPIPDEYMENDESKDIFVDEIFPKIATELKNRFTPTALAWTAEAWVRTMNKDGKMPDDYKTLPVQKEVIIITIESDTNKECVIYDIIRSGKQITSDGDMVDIVELVESENLRHPDGLGGRFAGLFSKLKD